MKGADMLPRRETKEEAPSCKKMVRKLQEASYILKENGHKIGGDELQENCEKLPDALLRCSPQYFARKWWESCDIRCSPQCFAPSCKKMVRNGQKGTWDARVNVLKENGRKRWETHPNISHLGGEYLSPILPNLQWTLEVENGKLDSLWQMYMKF